MSRLYSFCYEFREECFRVHFYDDQPNIINAESLGQINHQSRRKWAQRLFDLFKSDPHLLQLECMQDELDRNEFSVRLTNENWFPLTVKFEELQGHDTLHIYRFYLYLFDEIYVLR